MRRSRTIFTCLTALVLSTTAMAQIPKLITYQGVLLDDKAAPVADGDYTMKFEIFDAVTLGTSVWFEDRNTAGTKVTVTNGQFVVQLGEVTTLSGGSWNFDKPYWLEISVFNTGTATMETMAARVPFNTVPYAVVADQAFRADTANFALNVAAVDTVQFAFKADSAITATEVAGGLNTFPSSGQVSLGTVDNFPNLNIVSDSTLGIRMADSSNGFRLASLVGFPGSGGALQLRDGMDNLNILLRGYNVNNTRAYFMGGNVGFGIDPALARIHIMEVDADATGHQIRLENIQPGGRIFDLLVGGDGADENQVPRGGFSIYDATSGRARLAIDANGNVGIGLTNPGAGLEVLAAPSNTRDILIKGGGKPEIGLSLNNITTEGREYALKSIGAGSTQGSGKFQIFDYTAGAPRLTIDSTGNVGIGTASPQALLHVSGAGAAAGIMFPDNSLQTTAAVSSPWTPTGSDIIYSGKVGIGMSSPATPTSTLDVTGNIAATSLDVAGAVTANSLTLPATTRYYSIPAMQFAYPTGGIIGSDSSLSYIYQNFVGQVNVFAPVHLPHGATVTEIAINYKDNTIYAGADFISVKLRRATSNGSAIEMNISSFSSGSNVTSSATGSVIIDNLSYSYIMQVEWVSPMTIWDDIRLFNARIKYTVTEPLP